MILKIRVNFVQVPSDAGKIHDSSQEMSDGKVITICFVNCFDEFALLSR